MASNSSRAFKHFIDIAWRRKWWLVVSTLFSVSASLVLVGMTPKVYRAATTILVTRQGVPEGLARSTVTLRVEDRMRNLEGQIFSRPYLEQIAREFTMIPAEARESEIEGTCRQLHARIATEVDKRDFSWFRISVDDVDPKRAAGIANRLAELFIGQSSGMRGSQAAGTLEATEAWEAGYRLELTNRETEMLEFTQEHINALPDQQPANLQFLNTAENRVAQLEKDIRWRNDRLVVLRTEQQTQRALDVASGVPNAAPGGADPRLATLRRELLDLRGSYTEENPLVRRKREQIADLVRATPPDSEPGPIAARLDPSSVASETVENEIAALRRDRARELAVIEDYRARIGNASQLQPRFLELNRGYDQLKQQFGAALVRNEEAEHAQELEHSKKSDQFQIQDPAHPPASPHQSNILQFVISGMGLGLAIGVGAITAREFVDQSVRGEEEFAAWCPSLPVYGVIPNLDFDLSSHRGHA